MMGLVVVCMAAAIGPLHASFEVKGRLGPMVCVVRGPGQVFVDEGFFDVTVSAAGPNDGEVTCQLEGEWAPFAAEASVELNQDGDIVTRVWRWPIRRNRPTRMTGTVHLQNGNEQLLMAVPEIEISPAPPTLNLGLREASASEILIWLGVAGLVGVAVLAVMLSGRRESPSK